MHKGEDLDCKALSVMMRHLNILEIFSFCNRISFDLNYSRLARTSLTVILKCFDPEVQRV